jgi:nicotinate (nicotinamide) nucleotide adenylyltransferase
VIAIFGGTFDPPHLGHTEAINGLFDEPGFERVWILPSGRPGTKTPFLRGQERLKLAHIAFSEPSVGPQVEVLDTEVRWAEDHPGEVSTTWKTLPLLERMAQGEPLAWVIGTDQLPQLHRWDRFPDVLGRVNWLVLERAGEPSGDATLSEWQASSLIRPDSSIRSRQGRTGFRIHVPGSLKGTSKNWLLPVATPARAVSSTAIRQAFAHTGRAPEGSLAPELEAYLKLHGLYGSA